MGRWGSTGERSCEDSVPFEEQSKSTVLVCVMLCALVPTGTCPVPGKNKEDFPSSSEPLMICPCWACPGTFKHSTMPCRAQR
jgi:hypothetical protein